VTLHEVRAEVRSGSPTLSAREPGRVTGWYRPSLGAGRGRAESEVWFLVIPLWVAPGRAGLVPTPPGSRSGFLSSRCLVLNKGSM
jgi:hypothetical protein